MMTTENFTSQRETVIPTMPLSIVVGTVYGATWATLLLMASAAWGADEMGQRWIETALMRATIGLWFGAIGGALVALIHGTTRRGIDIDSESWSVLWILASTSLIAIAATILFYSALLPDLVGWLATTPWIQLQGSASGVMVMVLGLLLPALAAIRLLARKTV